MRRSRGPYWFEDREDHMRRNAGGLKEPRGPSADSQQDWGSRSNNPIELNSSSSQNEPGTGRFPRASRLEPSLEDTVILVFWYLKAWTSDLHNLEIVNGII